MKTEVVGLAITLVDTVDMALLDMALLHMVAHQAMDMEVIRMVVDMAVVMVMDMAGILTVLRGRKERIRRVMIRRT